MTIRRTTKAADAVLAIIEAMTNEDENYYAEPYQNGREHGWALWKAGNSQKQAVFSEYRRSDDIVVYVGTQGSFDMQGNVPDNKIYDDKKFFRFDQPYEAAKYILEHLNS